MRVSDLSPAAGSALRSRLILPLLDPADTTMAATGSDKRTTLDEFVFYLSPRSYGAVGDGVTDDTMALQNTITQAAAIGVPVVLGPEYNYKVTSLTVTASITGARRGRKATITTAANAACLVVSADNLEISGFRLVGAGLGASQIGISINGYIGWRIEDIEFNGLTLGTYFTTSGATPLCLKGGRIVDCEYLSCTTGHWSDARGEYMVMSHSRFFQCTTGIKVGAGNNKFVGCNVIYGVTGFQLVSGANDGHGEAVGCTFNHQTANGDGSGAASDAINANGLANGFEFIGCQVWQGTITLTACHNIQFTGGTYAVTRWYFYTTTVAEITGIRVDTLYGNLQYKDPGAIVRGSNVVDTNGNYAWPGQMIYDLGDAATINIDLGWPCDYFRAIVGGTPRTIAAPTNPSTVQEFTIEYKNNTAGAIATTWDASFHLAGAWVDPAAGKVRVIRFRRSTTGPEYIEVYRSPADITP